MSAQGVPVEEIARLVGHTGGSRVTESVYRKELRPVITTGAEVMDRVLNRSQDVWCALPDRDGSSRERGTRRSPNRSYAFVFD
jgi:hypothetical protein